MSASTAGEPRAGETARARATQRTAKLSVAAAVFLVAVKLATGLATGSLAFLAEAVHSGTDLVAALLTFFAVRVGLLLVRAGQPSADAAAALFVAVLVVIAGIRLAKQSIDVLMDRAVAD